MKKKKKKFVILHEILILQKTPRRLIPMFITDLFNTDMIVPTDPITFHQFQESCKK
jgi:hypothetical protein